MRGTTEISKQVKVRCGRSAVRIVPPATVLLEDNEAVEVEVPDLAGSNFLEVWEGQGWCCLIGLKGKTAIVIHCDQAQLRTVGPIERLDLGSSYDPGGFERIDFVDLPGGDVLIVHEIGVARVGSDGSLKWQRTHDDLTARHRGLHKDVIRFEGEHDRFGFNVGTGDPVFEPHTGRGGGAA
jgi:hypothetical protein